MTERTAMAEELFQKGFNCAQSVLCAFGNEAGMDRETCLRVAGSFGAGMAGRAETCGAVSGGLMALGLRYGMMKEGDALTKKKNYEEAKKFMAEFERKNGSVVCRDLLGCDIFTSEGAKNNSEKKLTSTLCPQLVKSAVEILENQFGGAL
jgi:C_GCAxxG_C_C family probable redox protein